MSAREFCLFVQKECPTQLAVRSDSDPRAPVGRSQDSFGKAEREVAMNTIHGTDMRNQEVLKRFFRVRCTTSRVAGLAKATWPVELKGAASVRSTPPPRLRLRK